MRSGKPGRFFFIPKGALTHHLVGTDSISLALPFGQSSLIPLFLLSPKSLATFRGPFRRWYFRWKSCALRGGCGFCGSLMDNATLEAKVLSLSTQLVRGILTEYRRFNRRYSTNCPHKSATTQGTPFGCGRFVCGYDYHYW